MTTVAGSGVPLDPTTISPSGRLLHRLLGPDLGDLRIEVYDGTTLGNEGAATTARILSPRFFHRVITTGGRELGFARAYVSGEVEIDGDINGIYELRNRIGTPEIDAAALSDAATILGIEHLSDLRRLRPLPPPAEEVVPRGRMHSRQRDSRAVSAHYDVSNDFYRLFLDPTMTYSCAVFETETDPLEVAQSRKYDLIGQKLGLQPGMRLLDVGCGWGGMAIHAARHFGVDAVGITISEQQYELAEKRVAEQGLADRIEIRLQDYRDVSGERFDAISSVGMFEHVGEKRLQLYFDTMARTLSPGGRLLNHAINRSQVGRHAAIDPNSFMARYVFPDGELLEPGQVISAINASGLEVRHMESIREHYVLTLRRWLAKLEENWDEAVSLVSLPRARIWRLYIAGSAAAFESNEITVTQILASKTTGGRSGLPLRSHWPADRATAEPDR